MARHMCWAASTRTRQTSGGISSGYSPSFQNMQLKTSYARGSGFKFNSPWWISLPWTHPVTSLADVTSQHPHPVVRSSAVWPCHVKSNLLLFPFLQLPAQCPLLLWLWSVIPGLSSALLNFTDVCCITLSALSVLRQESLCFSDPLCYNPPNGLSCHYPSLMWGNQQHRTLKIEHITAATVK